MLGEVLRVGQKFLTHVVPGVVKPIRILWNEVIGFVFFCFAVLFGFSAWRRFRGGVESGRDFMVALGCTGFCILLLWYGFSSFRRARKIGRS